MQKELIEVVVFKDGQEWETVPLIVNQTDTCTAKTNYHCHCWSWKLKTWDDQPLKECTTHGGFTDSNDPIERFKVLDLMDKGGEWGVFNKDGTCYDLCWMNTKEAKAEIIAQAKEKEESDISKIIAFDKKLRSEVVEQAQKEFLSIVGRIEEEKKEFISIKSDISMLKTSMNRYEKEPLYVAQQKVIRRHRENLHNERSRLHEQGLSNDTIEESKEIKDLKTLVEKTEASLVIWIQKTGRKKLNDQLASRTSEHDNLAARIANSETNIKRDIVPYFYDVLEGYINAKGSPHLQGKYLQYLILYERYIPRKIWGATYRKCYGEKVANEKSRAAMNPDSLVTKVSTTSEIQMGNIVITEKGVEKNTSGATELIAGGSMLGLSKVYEKASTPPSTPERGVISPPRGRGSRRGGK